MATQRVITDPIEAANFEVSLGVPEDEVRSQHHMDFPQHYYWSHIFDVKPKSKQKKKVSKQRMKKSTQRGKKTTKQKAYA